MQFNYSEDGFYFHFIFELLLLLFLFQSGRKETVLDLAKFVDKGVQVKLTGGRQGKLCASCFLILQNISILVNRCHLDIFGWLEC